MEYICKYCGNHGATKGYKGRTSNQYIKAKELGLPKPKISDETRKKLSIASKKYNENRIISKELREKLSLGGRHSVEIQGDKKRSKNEIEFCKLCEEYFDNVKHNECIFNGWDADVIIEDIKFAVLWNGPWHYKVITSQENLDAIKRRDQIKIKLIKKNGYIPYIIKDEDKSRAKDNNYVKEKFDEFLKYLKENTII